jgi:hypothetical protein
MTAFAWQLAIGTNEAPGLVWLLRHRIRGRKNILAVYRATMAGWRQAANAPKIRNLGDLA